MLSGRLPDFCLEAKFARYSKRTCRCWCMATRSRRAPLATKWDSAEPATHLGTGPPFPAQCYVDVHVCLLGPLTLRVGRPLRWAHNASSHTASTTGALSGVASRVRGARLNVLDRPHGAGRGQVLLASSCFPSRLDGLCSIGACSGRSAVVRFCHARAGSCGILSSTHSSLSGVESATERLSPHGDSCCDPPQERRGLPRSPIPPPKSVRD